MPLGANDGKSILEQNPALVEQVLARLALSSPTFGPVEAARLPTAPQNLVTGAQSRPASAAMYLGGSVVDRLLVSGGGAGPAITSGSPPATRGPAGPVSSISAIGTSVFPSAGGPSGGSTRGAIQPAIGQSSPGGVAPVGGNIAPVIGSSVIDRLLFGRGRSPFSLLESGGDRGGPGDVGVDIKADKPNDSSGVWA